MTERHLTGPDELRLTPLESGALACMLDGLPFKQAAKAMGRSDAALHKILYRAQAKFGAESLQDMMAQARRMVSGTPAP